MPPGEPKKTIWELVNAKIQDYPRDLSFVYGVSETLRRTAAS